LVIQRGANHLPPLPLSEDRNSSPQKVSSKREFLRFRLETFGIFSPGLRIFGAWRQPPEALKARNLQGFNAYCMNHLTLSEWLAGVAGIEP
jgi:hypothetical protein